MFEGIVEGRKRGRPPKERHEIKPDDLRFLTREKAAEWFADHGVANLTVVMLKTLASRD